MRGLAPELELPRHGLHAHADELGADAGAAWALERRTSVTAIDDDALLELHGAQVGNLVAWALPPGHPNRKVIIGAARRHEQMPPWSYMECLCCPSAIDRLLEELYDEEADVAWFSGEPERERRFLQRASSEIHTIRLADLCDTANFLSTADLEQSAAHQERAEAFFERAKRLHEVLQRGSPWLRERLTSELASLEQRLRRPSRAEEVQMEVFGVVTGPMRRLLGLHRERAGAEAHARDADAEVVAVPFEEREGEPSSDAAVLEHCRLGRAPRLVGAYGNHARAHAAAWDLAKALHAQEAGARAIEQERYPPQIGWFVLVVPLPDPAQNHEVSLQILPLR